MNSTVVLRRKKTNEDAEPKKENSTSGSMYFARPKSWGEFQSNLKVFQGVHAPRKSTVEVSKGDTASQQITEANERTTDNKAKEFSGVTFRKKPIEILSSSKFTGGNKQRQRPLSEVFLPTPFYKPFRAVGPPKSPTIINSVSDLNNNSENSKLVTDKPSVIAENLDVPSLEFEEAFDSDDSEIATISTSLPEAKQDDIPQKDTSKDYAAEKLYYVIPFRKEKQAMSKTADSNVQPNVNTELGAKTGPFQSLHKETHFKPVQTKDKLPIEEAVVLDEPASIQESNNVENIELENSNSSVGKDELTSREKMDLDSESSSMVDTGFCSFGERTESIVTVDAEIDFDLDVDDANSIPCVNKPSVSPKETRPGIPTPLRSCYRNSFEINNGYDSSSRSSSASIEKSSVLSSGNASEDDSASEPFSIDSTRGSRSNSSIAHGYEGDRSAEGSTYSRTEKEAKQKLTCPDQGYGNTIQQECELSVVVNEKLPDIDSTGSISPLKLFVHFQQPLQDNSDSIPAKRSLRWKDDQLAPVGALDRVTSSTENDQQQVMYHGTWPRRAQKSKRRQDQEEAEELMRRFRETAETYRARFRNIYAETRRKIEEAVFGLRIAMTKNGYDAKLHGSNSHKLIV